MRTDLAVDIACPAEDLWLFLDEPELQRQWMKGLVSNEISKPGPDRGGATFVMRLREGLAIAEYEGEIVVYDRPRHLAVRFWGGSLRPGMVVRVDYRLDATGEATRLAVASEMVEGRLGLLARLLSPVVERLNRAQLEGQLERLKQLAEGEG